ncbi:MAG: diguanylate cyclase [Armatimonadetes bacterium]|nr:diguanylate cyclase [Armatimonadota bacterium]
MIRVRVLAVDDQPDVLEAYQTILTSTNPAAHSEVDALEAHLFGSSNGPALSRPIALTVCRQGEEALDAVRRAHEAGEPFHVAFLDVRMPPGPDGVWTAEQLRAVDPHLEIVIVTAYSDIEPEAIAARVPPNQRLFYLQKPMHPQEIRQFALALGDSWWKAEELRRAYEEVARWPQAPAGASPLPVPQLLRELQAAAMTDPLTGLLNQGAFYAELRHILGSGAHEPVSLIVLDLDRFKEINDTAGHFEGNRVLAALADALRQFCRKSDILSRCGGDEFAVLMPDSGLEVSLRVAERAAQALREAGRDLGLAVPTTASWGIAVCPEDATDDVGLFRVADARLYEAKRCGGDQVSGPQAAEAGRSPQADPGLIRIRAASPPADE